MRERSRAVIALGANLGDAVRTVLTAADELAQIPDTLVDAVSSVHRTVAVSLDGPDPTRPTFANAVAVVRTSLRPVELLAQLHRIEDAHHRERHERWGDRTLDLDIIDVEGGASSDPQLVIPHPRAAERLFVLEPWLEVEPDAVLGGRPVADVARLLREGGKA